jgi:hypothetical protein
LGSHPVILFEESYHLPYQHVLVVLTGRGPSVRVIA